MQTIIKQIQAGLIVILLLSAFMVKAAEPVFVVYYASGKPVKEIKGKRIVLKKGDQLISTDKINLPEKAQLVIICKNFSAIQLKSKGRFNVTDLLVRCQDNSKSLTSAYFKYVWNEFTHHHASPVEDPRSYMKTVGAVSRGDEFDLNVDADTINYYNGPLTLQWLPIKALTPYVYDADGRLLFKGVKSTRIRIDSIAWITKEAGEYSWQLQNGTKVVNKRYVLKVLNKQQYLAAVAAIVKRGSTILAPAEDKAYLTGFMLEEHHYLNEAAKYYKKALQLAPANKIYKEANTKYDE